VLSEYVGYLVAQQQGRTNASSALPNAPVVPADERHIPAARLVPFRALLSGELRHLADRLEPAPRPNVSLALQRH